MRKLSRSGIIKGYPRHRVLKLRVIETTYRKLKKIQEEEGICMAFLLRTLLYKGLAEFTDLTEEELGE